jgi:hypothetical protein
MEPQNVSRDGRSDRVLGKAPEPNLWNLGWPAAARGNRIAQWLRTAFRVALPRKCDESVSDA